MAGRGSRHVTLHGRGAAGRVPHCPPHSHSLECTFPCDLGHVKPEERTPVAPCFPAPIARQLQCAVAALRIFESEDCALYSTIHTVRCRAVRCSAVQRTGIVRCSKLGRAGQRCARAQQQELRAGPRARQRIAEPGGPGVMACTVRQCAISLDSRNVNLKPIH